MSRRFPNKYDREAPASAARAGPKCDKTDDFGGGAPCYYAQGHNGPCMVNSGKGVAIVHRKARPKVVA